jgi:hypothetical protein
MIPLSPKCPFNDGKTAEAEALLKQALKDVREANLPMMQAKLLNSLGLVYSGQNQNRKAASALTASLRIIAGRLGTTNRLYDRVAANLHSLAA